MSVEVKPRMKGAVCCPLWLSRMSLEQHRAGSMAHRDRQLRERSDEEEVIAVEYQR